jgi:tetratricopeptide (TPR) repeat protein
MDDTYVKQGGESWGKYFERLIGHKGFGKSYALIIGVGDYDHHNKLSAPAADAERLREFLRDEANFDHIVTLTNEKATRERIEALMENEFPRLVGSSDRFLFYFSGHGDTRQVGADKRGYLVLKSSKPKNFDQMIDMPRVKQWTENLGQGRHVLFLLDACFSGLAVIERMRAMDVRDQTATRLMQPAHHIVTAGMEGEESFAFNGASIFTSAFLAAARGELGAPQDGIISLSEMVVKIKRYVDAKTVELNNQIKMTPRQFESRTQRNGGEFFFLPANTAAATTTTKAIPPQSVLPIQRKDAAGTETTSTEARDTLLKREAEAQARKRPVPSAPPAAAAAAYVEGEAHFAKGEHDQAIQKYTQAIQLDPEQAAFVFARGTAYLRKKETDRAIADYDRAISLDSTRSLSFQLRGFAYSEKGEYDRAISDYNEALRRDAGNAGAIFGRGQMHHTKGEYDRAIADYTEALRLIPNQEYYFQNRGSAYVSKGQYERALADYNEAIRINPKLAYSFIGRAGVHARKGEYDRAIADYSQALRLEPRSAAALHGRGHAYNEKGEHDRAIADYNQAAQINPQDYAAFVGRGAAYSYKKDYDQALREYTEAIKLNPKYELLYRGRAGVYFSKADYSRAIDDYNEAIRLNPKNTSALNYRGLAKLQIGDIAGGRADIASAKQIVPD